MSPQLTTIIIEGKIRARTRAKIHARYKQSTKRLARIVPAAAWNTEAPIHELATGSTYVQVMDFVMEHLVDIAADEMADEVISRFITAFEERHLNSIDIPEEE